MVIKVILYGDLTGEVILQFIVQEQAGLKFTHEQREES